MGKGQALLGFVATSPARSHPLTYTRVRNVDKDSHTALPALLGEAGRISPVFGAGLAPSWALFLTPERRVNLSWFPLHYCHCSLDPVSWL